MSTAVAPSLCTEASGWRLVRPYTISRGAKVRESAMGSTGRFVGARQGLLWISYGDDIEFRFMCSTFDDGEVRP